MNIFFSNYEAKKFRIFLENIKNNFENNESDLENYLYSTYSNFIYGDTSLKFKIKSFLTTSSLENNWILFNKLLVEKKFFKKPSFDKIKNKIFLVDTEDNFLNFQNKVYNSGNRNSTSTFNIENIELSISKIESKIIDTLNEDFKTELKTYFSSLDKKNDDLQVSLVIKLMKHKNKDTQKNIPKTLAGNLLNITTERMTKKLNPLIKEALNNERKN